MYGPLSRIAARWLAGALLGYGLVGPDTSDYIATNPDVALVLAGIIGAGVEGFYFLAKKKGWEL